MSERPVIEMLFPEIANLHGDNANMTYLAQCRPDAEIVRTSLNDAPAFASRKVDLLYLGPLTELGQLKAIDRLRAYAPQLRDRVESGAVSLFTHNAFEVLGARVRNDEMGYDSRGLGLFPFESTLHMMQRYSGKVTGLVPEAGDEHPIVGYKSQFSMVTGGEDLPGFLTATQGIGRNRGTSVEGVRVGNFLGTSLIGPLLVNNPYLTRGILARIDPNTEPTLAHESLAFQAYDARLRDFREGKRWHPHERVA